MFLTRRGKLNSDGLNRRALIHLWVILESVGGMQIDHCVKQTYEVKNSETLDNKLNCTYTFTDIVLFIHVI